MKALQKNKQAIQHNGIQKSSRNDKPSSIKKTQEADALDNMVFSEYEVWPILSALHKRQN